MLAAWCGDRFSFSFWDEKWISCDFWSDYCQVWFFLVACPDHKGAKSSTNCCEELVHLCDTWWPHHFRLYVQSAPCSETCVNVFLGELNCFCWSQFLGLIRLFCCVWTLTFKRCQTSRIRLQAEQRNLFQFHLRTSSFVSGSASLKGNRACAAARRGQLVWLQLPAVIFFCNE